MANERPKGYNIGWDVVGDNCVTTAAVPNSAPTIGYFTQYETLIWDYDGKQRRRIRDQIFHRNENEAKKVHEYITDNLRNKEGE